MGQGTGRWVGSRPKADGVRSRIPAAFAKHLAQSLLGVSRFLIWFRKGI